MKIKTSVTLSEDILQDLERVAGKGLSRSAIIERALRDYISRRAKKLRDAADLQILNKNFKRLNREASDVLTYQIDL
jgi:metal-responsive CopG/Arc/MetJ family transcriptional regulator